MFNLVVEVSAEPVVEKRALDVARRAQLHAHPVVRLVIVDLARQVTHLGRPHEPMALEESGSQVRVSGHANFNLVYVLTSTFKSFNILYCLLMLLIIRLAHFYSMIIYIHGIFNCHICR